LVSNYTIQYQIMNNVSIHGILTRKKLIKHSLRLLVPLIFASWCLLCKTPVVGRQYIWTPFYTVPLFSLGNILMEPFTMFIRDGSHVFRGKKSTWEYRKLSFNDMLYPIALYDEIVPPQIHCNFPLFHCLDSFCRCFQLPSRFFFL